MAVNLPRPPLFPHLDKPNFQVKKIKCILFQSPISMVGQSTAGRVLMSKVRFHPVRRYRTRSARSCSRTSSTSASATWGSSNCQRKGETSADLMSQLFDSPGGQMHVHCTTLLEFINTLLHKLHQKSLAIGLHPDVGQILC